MWYHKLVLPVKERLKMQSMVFVDMSDKGLCPDATTYTGKFNNLFYYLAGVLHRVEIEE